MLNGRGMSENKSSISRARSYKELSEFWDSHDLSEYWDQLRPAEFEVDIQSEATLLPARSHSLGRASVDCSEKRHLSRSPSKPVGAREGPESHEVQGTVS